MKSLFSDRKKSQTKCMKAENMDLPLPFGVEKPLSTPEPANVAQFKKKYFLEKLIIDFKALPMLEKNRV